VTRGQNLSLAHQASALRQVFPEGMASITHSKLVWIGTLSPTPLSCEYTVRVNYSVGANPQAIILDPPLVPDQNGFLPHFYREGSICLYAAREWDGSMLIVETIIPWATEWLAHYELWKWRGQWYGDGDLPHTTTTASRSASDLKWCRELVRSYHGQHEAAWRPTIVFDFWKV
jgi:hypothetical protein